MKIALSCDHRGTGVYKNLIDRLNAAGHSLVAVPICDGHSCDYPDMAYGVGKAIADGRAERGILICGSGVGMCIAVNKLPGVRGALVHDDITAEVSRRHNDANVICLSADLLGQKLIEQIVEIFLATKFEGGRHARRIAKIAAIEAGDDPGEIIEIPDLPASDDPGGDTVIFSPPRVGGGPN